MFQSHFEESVSLPLLYIFLCHVPIIFCSSGVLFPDPTDLHISQCHFLFARCETQTLWSGNTVSSKSVQINTCSGSQCSSAAEKAQEAAKGTNGCPQCQLLMVLPCARGSSQHSFLQALWLSSVAVVASVSRYSLIFVYVISGKQPSVKCSIYPTLEYI